MDPFRTGGTSPPEPSRDIVPTTTPEKRKRGKCMSCRSQAGSIEKSGK